MMSCGKLIAKAHGHFKVIFSGKSNATSIDIIDCFSTTSRQQMSCGICYMSGQMSIQVVSVWFKEGVSPKQPDVSVINWHKRCQLLSEFSLPPVSGTRPYIKYLITSVLNDYIKGDNR